LVKIGQGRAGAVYVCGSPTDDDRQVVAIKETTVPVRFSLQRRLTNEIRAMQATASSPHTLTLRDAFLFQQGALNKVWLIMDWAQHGPLTDIIRRVRLSEPQMSVIMRQLLAGVLDVHRAGWLHRDLKSDNVLITKEGQVKVGDFGAACKVGDVAGGEQRVGTPHWMAPETIKSNVWSEKTDCWAAGVVLVEMVNGEPPNWSLSQNQILGGQSFHELSHLKLHGSPDLLDLVSSMLTVDPEKRCTVKQALCHPFIAKYADLPASVILPAIAKCKMLP
jgi:serine/threonine protein kinase